MGLLLMGVLHTDGLPGQSAHAEDVHLLHCVLSVERPYPLAHCIEKKRAGTAAVQKIKLINNNERSNEDWQLFPFLFLFHQC